jgi:hypothetical protein
MLAVTLCVAKWSHPSRLLTVGHGINAVPVTCMLTGGRALMCQGKQQQVRELTEKLQAAYAGAAKQGAAAAENEEAYKVRV